ncbi:MAG: aldose 1-epimerase family protein [Actinomycetota bacterium]|nr:aldose 1-epimerase family protein [Actinomycetota bacterium]
MTGDQPPAAQPVDLEPTGTQIELTAAGYRAVVTEVGGRLRQLSWHGRHLVRTFAADHIPTLYTGAVLAPWPNRLAGGSYSFGGRPLQLPINEVDRGNALHGLVADRQWTIAEASKTSATLQLRQWPTEGYPFLLDLTLRYALDNGGLTVELAARNNGHHDAPYGCSIHPYLVAGDGTVDDWTLRLAADSYLSVDPERLLPQGLRPVDAFDFREGRSLAGLVVDHAFTGLSADAAGISSLQLTAPDGAGVTMSWTRSTPWVQLCTADRPEPEFHRTGLAAEPMTCPPDAFNSGTDLVTLSPGEAHTTQIWIAGLGR